MWCARTNHGVKGEQGGLPLIQRWLTWRPCCHDDDPVTSRDKPGFMGDPHSKNNRHRPALPSHRPFSPFAFSTATQTNTHTQHTRGHACTHSSIESPTPQSPRMSQHNSLLTLRCIFLLLRFFYNPRSWNKRLLPRAKIILVAGPDSTKRWWRGRGAHKYPCYDKWREMLV